MLASDEEQPPKEKQGSKFFGCCCDMRRALIIVNIIGIAVGCFSLIALLLPGSFAKDIFAGFIDDDELKDEFIKQSSRQAFIAIPIGIPISFVAIWGALKYNTWAIVIRLVQLFTGFCVQIVSSIQFSNKYEEVPVNIVFIIFQVAFVGVLLIYPHAVFLIEVRKGIMIPSPITS